MIKKLTRIFGIAFLIAILALPATPVLAIAPPSAPTPTIDEINVYKVNTSDWIYVIRYTITYGSLPSEDITAAYIFRIMNGATELKSGTAYAYNTKGYGTGICSIYFTGAEISAKAMVWNTAYTVEIAGNPLLTWTGSGCPDVTSTTYKSWNDPGQATLATDVMTLAYILSANWDLTTTALWTNVSGTILLSSYGEIYFSTSIFNLLTLCPSIFSASVAAARYYERTHPLTGATDLEGYTFWTGSWLDLTPIATLLAIPPSYLYGGLWCILIAGALVALSSMPNPGVAMPLATGLMLVGGALMHFLPMLAPTILGAMLILLTLYLIFYKPSYG